MRLGAQEVVLEPGSLASALYGNKSEMRERFRHRYEVEPRYIDQLQEAGLRFSGRHPKFPIMQVLELPQSVHPYFVGGQFHPELTSRPLAPNPMFMGLIAAAIAGQEPEFAQSELGRRWVRSAPKTVHA
jgi:CTP synthase